jgi:hypothetical protein
VPGRPATRFTHAGKPNHEIGLYFSARFSRESALAGRSISHWGIEGSQRLEFGWFDAVGLADVDLRPVCLRPFLLRPDSLFRHLVQRG